MRRHQELIEQDEIGHGDDGDDHGQGKAPGHGPQGGKRQEDEHAVLGEQVRVDEQRDQDPGRQHRPGAERREARTLAERGEPVQGDERARRHEPQDVDQADRALAEVTDDEAVQPLGRR